MEHSRQVAFRYEPYRMPIGGQAVLTKHFPVNCGTTDTILASGLETVHAPSLAKGEGREVAAQFVNMWARDWNLT